LYFEKSALFNLDVRFDVVIHTMANLKGWWHIRLKRSFKALLIRLLTNFLYVNVAIGINEQNKHLLVFQHRSRSGLVCLGGGL